MSTTGCLHSIFATMLMIVASDAGTLLDKFAVFEQWLKANSTKMGKLELRVRSHAFFLRLYC